MQREIIINAKPINMAIAFLRKKYKEFLFVKYYLMLWLPFEMVRQRFLVNFPSSITFLRKRLEEQEKPLLNTWHTDFDKKLEVFKRKLTESDGSNVAALEKELKEIKKEAAKFVVDEEIFYFYCWNKFHIIINSLKACHLLIKKGHYYESVFIIRNLLEGIVEIKYLRKNKDKSLNFWNGNNGGWRHIFEEVIPGLYDSHYKASSSITHGNALSMIYFVIDSDDLIKSIIRNDNPYVVARGSVISIYYLAVLYLALLNEFYEIFKLKKTDADKLRYSNYLIEIYKKIERLDLTRNSYKGFKNPKWKSLLKKLI